MFSALTRGHHFLSPLHLEACVWAAVGAAQLVLRGCSGGGPAAEAGSPGSTSGSLPGLVGW